MRQIVLLALFSLLASALVIPKQRDCSETCQQLKCPLCEFLVQNEEKWLGAEGQKDEPWLIQTCERLLSSKGDKVDSFICDEVVKDAADLIIADLENEKETEKSAEQICQNIKYCPAPSMH